MSIAAEHEAAAVEEVVELSPEERKDLLIGRIFHLMKKGQAFGDDLANLRRMLEMPAERLSTDIGYHKSRISNWERRTNWESRLSREDIARFGRYFGLT